MAGGAGGPRHELCDLGQAENPCGLRAPPPMGDGEKPGRRGPCAHFCHRREPSANAEARGAGHGPPPSRHHWGSEHTARSGCLGPRARPSVVCRASGGTRGATRPPLAGDIGRQAHSGTRSPADAPRTSCSRVLWVHAPRTAAGKGPWISGLSEGDGPRACSSGTTSGWWEGATRVTRRPTPPSELSSLLGLTTGRLSNCHSLDRRGYYRAQGSDPGQGS